LPNDVHSRRTRRGESKQLMAKCPWILAGLSAGHALGAPGLLISALRQHSVGLDGHQSAPQCGECSKCPRSDQQYIIIFSVQAHLYFLHVIKGAPWLSTENDPSRRWTHWEQIDDGVQMTTTRKFLTAVPIVL